MSMWIIKKRQNGSGGTEISTFPFAELLLPLMILIGMLAAIGPNGALLLSSFGFILFLAAKVSQLLKGIYVSWGSKSMSRGFRACYRLGYGLMIAGFLAGLLSLKMRR